jgi:hypothetical protein
MVVIYKAYAKPFGFIRWLPANADVPYFGRLLGVCTDTNLCTYELNECANFAEFLQAIPQAPWQLLDGRGQAEVEIAVPPCESLGRTEEVKRKFLVKGSRYRGFFGFLQEYVSGPLVGLGISLVLLMPLQFATNQLCLWAVAPLFAVLGFFPPSAILEILSGLLVGAAIVLIVLLIKVLHRKSLVEQLPLRCH